MYHQTPEAPSYTPPAAHETWWRLTHQDGSVKEALGQTAFYACAHAKWLVGEVVKFEQIPEPSKGPAERISALLARRKAELENWDARIPSDVKEGHGGKLCRAKMVAGIEYLTNASDKNGVPFMTARALHVLMSHKQDDHEFEMARIQGQIDAAEEVEGL